MVSKCNFSTMALCVLCTACHCVAFLCMYDVKYTLCTTPCLPMYHCVVLTWRHAAPLGVIPWCRRPLGACPSQYVSAVFLYAVREGIYIKKEKNVFFRALSKFPEPPTQAIWSLYLDVKNMCQRLLQNELPMMIMMIIMVMMKNYQKHTNIMPLESKFMINFRDNYMVKIGPTHPPPASLSSSGNEHLFFC